MVNNQSLFKHAMSHSGVLWRQTLFILLSPILAVIAVIVYAVLDIWCYYYEFFIVAAAGLILGLLISIPLLRMTLCEFTITEKSVCAKDLLGKQLELSVNKITAISETKWSHTICVFTPAGRITVMSLINSHEAFSILSSLLTND